VVVIADVDVDLVANSGQVVADTRTLGVRVPYCSVRLRFLFLDDAEGEGRPVALLHLLHFMQAVAVHGGPLDLLAVTGEGGKVEDVVDPPVRYNKLSCAAQKESLLARPGV
jgi:hypothetical protein